MIPECMTSLKLKLKNYGNRVKETDKEGWCQRMNTDKKVVLLLHGMGFRDNGIINYWGRIPKLIESRGYKVYYGNQDSNAPIEVNGQVIANRLQSIFEETNCNEIHIIAHSKGGLDARYAISSLGMDRYVSTLTTISTPHNGSPTVDRLLTLPGFCVRIAALCTDLCLRIAGDRHPDAYHVFHSFTTKEASQFNASNPDSPTVCYRSYAFVMRSPFSDIFLWLPNLIVGHYEGENDGLLSPEDVKWGEFKGVIRSRSLRGISHCDEVDMRRRRFTKKQGEHIGDILELYSSILDEYEERK